MSDGPASRHIRAADELIRSVQETVLLRRYREIESLRVEMAGWRPESSEPWEEDGA